jgi:hypothetical protein
LIHVSLQAAKIHVTKNDGSHSNVVDYRAQLTELYAAHNPAKLSDIDRLLEKYSGHEDEMIHSVRVKYGLEQDTEYYRRQLTALYTKYNPEKVADIDSLLQKYKYNERQFLDAVQNKYLGQAHTNAASNAEAKDYRQKLIDLYKECNPDKVGDVDSLLKKYEGHEVELLQSVQHKYHINAAKVPADDIASYSRLQAQRYT